MSDRMLRIRMAVVGAGNVTRAVRGITQSSQGATRTQVRGEQTVAREAQRSARAQEAATARAARARVRAEQQAQRQIVAAERAAQRERDRIARDEQRNANEVFRTRMRLHQQRIRAEQQTQRQQDRVQRRAEARQRAIGRRGDLAVAGGGFAALGAVLATTTTALESFASRVQSTASAMGQRAGVMDVGERTANAQDVELRLAQASGELFQGQSPEQTQRSMVQLSGEIASVSQSTGVAPTEILNSLAIGQSEFSAFDLFRENMQAIAEESQRTGASMEDLTRFLGVLHHQLGDTAPSASTTFDILAQQGLQGSVTPEQLSREFAGQIGTFMGITGLSGEEGLRQFGALANAAKSNDRSAAETATDTAHFLSDLGNSDVRDRLRMATGGHMVGHGRSAHAVGGTTALRDDGTVDLPTLVRDLATIDQVGTSDVVFGNAASRRVAGRLAMLQRTDRGTADDVATFDELRRADAAAGGQLRAGNLATVMGTSAVESARIAAAGQLEGIASLQERARGGNDLLAYQEAVTRSPLASALLGQDGAIGSVPLIGETLRTLVAPELARRAGALSPEQLTASQSLLRNFGAGQAAMGPGGIGLGVGLGFGSLALGGLAQLGTQASAISKNSQSTVRVEDGARMELGDDTVRRISTGIAAAMPAPTGAPTTGGRTSSGAPRTPTERR